MQTDQTGLRHAFVRHWKQLWAVRPSTASVVPDFPKFFSSSNRIERTSGADFQVITSGTAVELFGCNVLQGSKLEQGFLLESQPSGDGWARTYSRGRLAGEEKGIENCHELEPLVARTFPKFLKSQRVLPGK